MERLLYRLSISEYSDKFLLKGALLFFLWFNNPNRPTRDIDLLGYTNQDLETIKNVFRSISIIDAEDGVLFDPKSLQVSEIKKEQAYPGVRVLLKGNLNTAKLNVQIDIGFGDIVTPEPQIENYPIILSDLPQVQIGVYPLYTVIAEKYHTICIKGGANSRLKDYYDLNYLISNLEIDKTMLITAIKNTFKQRKTRIPTERPEGLKDDFSNSNLVLSQWKAFVRKNYLEEADFNKIVKDLPDYLSKTV